MAKSVQFTTDKRLATTKGHVYRFKARTPRDVPDHIYREAMAQGGIDGKMKITAGDEDGEGEDIDTGEDAVKPPIEFIAEAVRDIIDQGDSSKLIESSGKVRVDALNNELNRDDITAEDRDEAHKLLEEGEA